MLSYTLPSPLLAHTHTQVIVTVQPPQGRAAFDPLAALGSWAAPTSTPGFDPVRALLGVSPPAGQPLFSLFRGLAEAEPQAGVGTEAWDVVGALLQAGAPVAKSKYDIMQGRMVVQGVGNACVCVGA